MQISSADVPDRKRIYVALVVAAGAVALAVPTLGQAGARGNKGEDVTVMTRNIYLGADLTPALRAQSITEVESADADIVAEVQRTDFPARAKLLAKEIDKAEPDLVGLQEVALWRTDTDPPTCDLGEDFGGTPAQTVYQDFLAILKQELKRVGAPYRVANVQEEFDQELPVQARPGDPQPDSAESTCPGGVQGYDGRLTMRDAILARKGVKTTQPKGEHFDHLLTVTISGAPIQVERGWISVQAKVRGESFRFVDTHLEAFDEGDIRAQQAQELVSGPAKSKKDVVLLGDFNTGNKSRHKIGVTSGDAQDRQAWTRLTKGGFFERQTKAFSCCYSSALDASAGKLDHTVDHILVNDKDIGLGKSFITGDNPKQMTPSGLWPSDHGGVVSTLEFPG